MSTGPPLVSAHETPSRVRGTDDDPGRDRRLAITLGCSLLGHALVFGAPWLRMEWRGPMRPLPPTKLIYEPEAAKARLPWSGAREEETPRRDLPDPSRLSLQNTSADGAQAVGMQTGAVRPDFGIQIKTGEESGAWWSAPSTSRGGSWGKAIDLTNLSIASQGNPVLYSYFSAMREQIQRTANGRAWLPKEATRTGTVHVGFIVSRTGAIQSVAVVPERSVEAPLLQEAAVRIIEASSPFLPFPPSLPGASKTIVVPIEFTLNP